GVRPTAPVQPAVPPVVVQPATPVENIPSVLPVVSFRGQVAELSGSMALSVVLAGLLAVLYAALARYSVQNVTEIGSIFFLTVALCWAVLVPAKFWNSYVGDSWLRRVVMMVLGAAVGFGALWLLGHYPPPQASEWLASVPRSRMSPWSEGWSSRDPL